MVHFVSMTLHCNCIGKNDQSLFKMFHFVFYRRKSFWTTNDDKIFLFCENTILLLFAFSSCTLSSLYVLATLSCFFLCLFHIFPHSDESLTPTGSFVSSITLSFILFYFPSFSGQLHLSHLLFYVLPLSVSASVFFSFLLSSCFLFAAYLVGQFFIISFLRFCPFCPSSLSLSFPGKRICMFALVTTDNIWVITLVNHMWSLVFIFPMSKLCNTPDKGTKCNSLPHLLMAGE